MPRLLHLSNYAMKTLKNANAHQRQKYYSKFPHIFKQKTIIRPPDLTQPNITFPINIPIRFRHIYKPTKSLFIDNISKIKWNRFSPNQILLGFENIKYLTYEEVVQGLKTLSKVEGQEKFNWNEHQWVKEALKYFRQNFGRIKKGEHMGYYYLMKKLNNKDQGMWQKLYKRLQQDIYDLSTGDFEMLFIKYHENPSPYFSQKFKANSFKLMEGRIRQFKGQSILKIFQMYLNHKLLTPYYIQNVFTPLFKNKIYQYNANQIARIFRFMMMVSNENSDRLYASLYSQILDMKFTNKKDLQFLTQVIEEVKQIFTSHRVDNILAYLRSEKQQVKNRVVETKKKLYQIVKEDLTFFVQKRKLKSQQI